MSTKRKTVIGALLGVAALAVLWVIQFTAAGSITYWGCLDCEVKSIMGVLPNDSCRDVVGDWGSTYCTEAPFLLGGQTCSLHGEACQGITVIGPGGGGGGGAGGIGNPMSPCIIYGAQWCPAECSECIRRLY